jgi:hypothetical protein
MKVRSEERKCSRCGRSKTLVKGQTERWYGGPLCCRCYGAIYREKHRDINRIWRAKNADYVRERQKKWRDNHPGYYREWRVSHPDYSKRKTKQ